MTKRNVLLVPEPVDPYRCTGRTTAIALEVLGRAIGNQGKVCYAVDHYNPGTHSSALLLQARIQQCAAVLGLTHLEVRPMCTTGQYNGYVYVRSNIWVED